MRRLNKIPSKFTLNALERQVAELVIEGFGDKEIGEMIGRPNQVVKNTLADLYFRFDIENDSTKRVSLAVYLHAHLEQFGLRCVSCA